MFPSLAKGGRNLLTCGRDLGPHRIRELDGAPWIGRIRRRNNDSIRRQPWQHRLSQVLTHFAEAQATGLVFGVFSAGAKRGEIIVAIDEDHAIEIGIPRGVGRADQGMQGERDGPIAARQPVNERANTWRIDWSGHGFLGGRGMMDLGSGFPLGPVFVGAAARCVESAIAFGSMKRPNTESAVVTVATCCC